jgi:hypothetical protein
VLKVLDQTTRPVHAVAGAADAAVTGKDVLRAAKRGIQNKDRTTFSDVLKHAGVKNKTVRGVAGFGLDVALDPTTYVTGGEGGGEGGFQGGRRCGERCVQGFKDGARADSEGGTQGGGAGSRRRR